MNGTPCIYVIEDEESISKLIELYLTKEQMEAKTFFNAEDALKDLKEGHKPNLIILDLNLPGMSGFDFLEELQKHFQKDLPSVMILSARDTDEDIIKGLGYGADEFVTKPFSPGVLMARVKANLRRQSFFADEAAGDDGVHGVVAQLQVIAQDERHGVAHQVPHGLSLCHFHPAASLPFFPLYTGRAGKSRSVERFF
jgi:DNA-binding response OmpR family regulator